MTGLTIDNIRKRSKHCLVRELDFEKAYDRVGVFWTSVIEKGVWS